MKANKDAKKIIFIGKFKDVSSLLKEYLNKYIYLQELIDAVNSDKTNNFYLN